MNRLLVFDLDGTLIDTLEDLAFACNEALRFYNYPVRSIAEVQSFIGNGVKRLMALAAPEGLTEEQHEALLIKFKEIYSDNLWQFSQVYPDMPDVLQELKNRGDVLAVLTNKSQVEASRLIEHFFPGIFTIVIGQSDRFPKKPAADALLFLIEEFATGKENVIYIGDSEVDMKTAKAAETYAVGVSWGFRTADVLREHDADTILNKSSEILDI